MRFAAAPLIGLWFINQEETCHIPAVIQYHFLLWLDHSVPSEAAGVLDLLERTTQLSSADTLQLKKTTETPASCRAQQSRLIMNDTYAVVNKPKHPHPPPANPTHFGEAPPRSSRTLPSSHHYDNDHTPSSASPIYSCVRQRKPHSLPLTATPIYDVAMPTNHRSEEGLLSLQNNGVTDERLSTTDDEYEDFSSSVTEASGLCSPGGIGFNCRIQKPKGPRDPPAEWIRLER